MRLILAFIVPLAYANPSCAASPCTNPDADGDGADSIECGGDDCDDNDARRYPGAVEVCDADQLDEDCNPATGGDKDTDGDGFVDELCCNDGGTCGTDCDDDNASISPMATEVCNNEDDNCDGAFDEGLVMPFWSDNDSDGFGTQWVGDLCVQDGAGLARRAGDCDDGNPAIVPGSMVCGQLPEDVLVCESDGTFRYDACAATHTCYIQPNATGVCAP